MINVEIKARSSDEQHLLIRKILTERFALCKGMDRQTDTYFNVSHGRLKLREGNIENCLIQYDRPNQGGPKVSKYRLVQFQLGTPCHQLMTTLWPALEAALGVKTVVAKSREIYYLDNVKIHLDNVHDLGKFVEIEARDETETIGLDKLTEQTNMLMSEFQIKPEDLIHDSYSDMMLKE